VFAEGPSCALASASQKWCPGYVYDRVGDGCDKAKSICWVDLPAALYSKEYAADTCGQPEYDNVSGFASAKGACPSAIALTLTASRSVPQPGL